MPYDEFLLGEGTKFTWVFVPILRKLEVSQQTFIKVPYTNFAEIRPVRPAVIHANRRTDMAMPICTCSDYTNALEKNIFSL
jgi:hypothetical protein